MTNSEVISIVLGAFTIVGAGVGAWFKLHDRISKCESHTQVCDEKHKTHDKKWLKQDEFNLKVDEHHVEVMTKLSILETLITRIGK